MELKFYLIDHLHGRVSWYLSHDAINFNRNLRNYQSRYATHSRPTACLPLRVRLNTTYYRVAAEPIHCSWPLKFQKCRSWQIYLQSYSVHILSNICSTYTKTKLHICHLRQRFKNVQTGSQIKMFIKVFLKKYLKWLPPGNVRIFCL